jgi:hypothetical protein
MQIAHETAGVRLVRKNVSGAKKKVFFCEEYNLSVPQDTVHHRRT